MFNLRKWLFDDPTADWKQIVNDPKLGELRLSEDADWWATRVTMGDRVLQFRIGGEVEPDSILLAHAHDIVRDLPQFEHRLAAYLVLESVKLKDWTEEIKHLRLAEINLFWAQRPNDGEIVFSESDQYRIWRCGYTNREFVGLGFDD